MYKTVQHDGVTDEVAIEEPLEIRVDGEALAVTMRTPGHDEELALGFLYGEGLIDGPRAAGLTDDLAANVIEVAGPLTRIPSTRRFYTSSSCGVCGKGALEEVAVASAPLAPGPSCRGRWWPSCRHGWSSPPSRAPAACTPRGCSVPAGSCISRARTWADTTPWTRWWGGRCSTVCSRSASCVLCVSGRLSFELVQKAAVAGAPILVGVGAPSSLAIELADDRGLTLCGFARRGSVNVYTRPERIVA